MKHARILLTCAVGLVTLTAATSPTAPAPTYSTTALSAARTLMQQNVGRCSGPQYGAMVQQCIQSRCVTGTGSVAQCAASCEAQVRAQCGA